MSISNLRLRFAYALAIAAGLSLAATIPAQAFFLFDQPLPRAPQWQAPAEPQAEDSIEQPSRLKRQVVDYRGSEAPGTVVIDTPNTYLYFVLPGGKAMRYGIGVGREGFTWSGVQSISRKAEWPDWTPPAEMLQRQPYLPRFVAGGPGNPLGARALYLGNSIYRIHGTNVPSSIGTQVSSGCIRMVNEDVIDLYSRVTIGTKVVVRPGSPRQIARGLPDRVSDAAPAARRAY
jgi:lipoprotein-anchoring transpeptidase ErfK/SrfK